MPAPLPSYILDQLYASLDPLVARLTTVWAKVATTYTAESSKAAWYGALTQASNQIQDASINGRRGQLLAMGELTLAGWSAGVDAAADTIEFVAAETGTAGYSIRRVWNEIVVPTAVDVVEQIPNIGKGILDWTPLVVVGVIGLVVWQHASNARRALSGYRRRRRK